MENKTEKEKKEREKRERVKKEREREREKERREREKREERERRERTSRGGGSERIIVAKLETLPKREEVKEEMVGVGGASSSSVVISPFSVVSLYGHIGFCFVFLI